MSITNSCMQSGYHSANRSVASLPIINTNPSLEGCQVVNCMRETSNSKAHPSALTGSLSPLLRALVEHLDGGNARRILMGPLKGAGKGHHGRRQLSGPDPKISDRESDCRHHNRMTAERHAQRADVASWQIALYHRSKKEGY